MRLGMDRCEHVALVPESHWPVEVLPLSSRLQVVVFACHHLKVGQETLFSGLLELALRAFRMNRNPTLPVELGGPVIEVVFPGSVERGLIDIPDVVPLLLLARPFVEELLVMSARVLVVSGRRKKPGLIPSGSPLVARFIDTKMLEIAFDLLWMEPVHLLF